MLKNLHLRSALIGAALTLTLAFLLGADISSRNATSSGPRYQMVMGGKYCFVLDSKTGQVWQKGLTAERPDTSKRFLKEK